MPVLVSDLVINILIMILKNIFNHQISKNLLALVILQMANYLFPLLSWPLLAKYLGLEQFGEFMIFFSIFMLALVITDFGFNLSATHKVSLNRENKAYIGLLLGNIFSIKLFLAIVAVFSSAIYINYQSFRYINTSTLLFSSLIIFIQSFQCVWFYQGIEKMKNITKINIFSKVVYLFLLVIILPFFANLNIAILCYAISQMLGVFFFIRNIYKEGYFISYPKMNGVFEEIKHSFTFFISRVAVSIYTTINTLIIGNVSGASIAGLYGSAEKLYNAGSTVSGMLSQALYPNMAKTNNLRLLVKIVVFASIPYFIGCFIASFWTLEIVTLIFGGEFAASAELLKLFIALMCITFVSVTIGYPGFAAVRKVQWANYSVIFGAIFHFCGMIYLLIFNMITPQNVLILVIVTESIILIIRVLLLIFFRRK